MAAATGNIKYTIKTYCPKTQHLEFMCHINLDLLWFIVFFVLTAE